MPVTVRLPPDLHGAEFRAPALRDGQTVEPGQPLASFKLDERVVVMPSPVGGVVLRTLLSEEIECRAGDPIAFVGQPGEVLGYEPDRVECVRLRLLDRCEECGNDYPINGLVQSARCTRCGDVRAIPKPFWRSAAEDINNARVPGARGGGVTLGGPTVDCRGVPPMCRKCHALLAMDAFDRAYADATAHGRATIACAHCGEPHAARLPPAWSREVLPDATFVVGEVTGEVLAEAPKPVVFKCPSCMASLQIAGERRIVRCQYCESDVYLPDDLWLHFNPASKRALWWLVFQPRRGRA